MNESIILEDLIQGMYQWKFISDALKKIEIPALIVFTKTRNRANAMRRAKSYEKAIIEDGDL